VKTAQTPCEHFLSTETTRKLTDSVNHAAHFYVFTYKLCVKWPCNFCEV